jgi:arylsulfatase A-like enzyme
MKGLAKMLNTALVACLPPQRRLWLTMQFACGLLGVSLLVGISPAAADGEKPRQRPNLLVLVTDDQRWDQLSCADAPIIPQLETPHLDSLAARGVYFRNAFATTPICAVSRASIMTGRYVSTHGMNHFRTSLDPATLRKTYPAVLKQHGYRTGMLGKWGMGTEGTREVFDVFQAWMTQGVYFHATEEGLIHNSEWLARRAHEFLESNPEGQPFCLTVCYKSPHHPYEPDPRDRKAFETIAIPRQPTDTPAAYNALPGHVMDESLNRWCYFDERKDEATREDFEKNFLRCVLSLDRSVGAILRSLKQLGLDENTAVVFLSDHGYLWGEHGLGGKWLLYEESIRIPLIIVDPTADQQRRGARVDSLALNIDIAPTLLDLAGLPIPTEMDGVSLKPPVHGKESPPRNHFFMEHVGVIETKPPIPDSEGVRTEEWKYLRYVNAEPEVEALYHLQVDRGETQNRINDPDCAETLQELRRVYRDYKQELRAR